MLIFVLGTTGCTCTSVIEVLSGSACIWEKPDYSEYNQRVNTPNEESTTN